MMARRRKGGKTISRPGRAYDADVAARSSYDARFQAKLERIKRRQRRQGVSGVAAIPKASSVANDAEPARPSWPRRIWGTIGWCVWLLVAWLLSSLIVSLVIVLLRRLANYNAVTDVIGMAIMQVVQLLLMLALVVIIPERFGRAGRQRPSQTLADQHQRRYRLLGVDRRPNCNDVIPLLASIGGYYLLGLIATAIASLVLPTDVMTQAQNVGFNNVNNGWWQAILIVFIMAAVTPVFEELIFRGFLLGRVQRLLGFWPAALVVSLLFAVAHGQVNVGLTTFVLSMIACYGRKHTGAIWSGIGLHMAVNLVAASLVFVLPMFG